MNLLNRLGWQTRKAHAGGPRRSPAWVSGYARSAEDVSGIEDSWSALPEAGSYKLAAERYMVSDLVYMCVSKLASLASGCQLALFDDAGLRCENMVAYECVVLREFVLCDERFLIASEKDVNLFPGEVGPLFSFFWRSVPPAGPSGRSANRPRAN